MAEQANKCQCGLISENSEKDEKLYKNEFSQYIHNGYTTVLQLVQKPSRIIIGISLLIFTLASIGVTYSFKSGKLISDSEQFPTLRSNRSDSKPFPTWRSYRSDSGSLSCIKSPNNGFGYPAHLIEDLVRDKEISFVFPVHTPDRDFLLNLLRSIRELCVDCSEVPIIVITDDGSRKVINESFYTNTSLKPGEPTIAQSFPKLLVKLLRDVIPYYEVNKWNDGSLLVNGKFLFQSHKKMFGALNGASTRFSWVMDVDSFLFKPMSLAKVLKTYLSSPYIFTSHDWTGGQDIYDCAQNLTGSFLSTGYTVEVMHWVLDREILSDFNNVVLKQYPNWNVPRLFRDRYFFEHTYYHFIMSNQILHRKYMQYKIVEIRTLFGGNQSPLLHKIITTAVGGMIERIGTSVTREPSIYPDVVRIWKEFKIPFFRPDGSISFLLDFALDTDVVMMTNTVRDELYRMAMSGYWKNPELALENAEKEGWKSVADLLNKRKNMAATPK